MLDNSLVGHFQMVKNKMILMLALGLSLGMTSNIQGQNTYSLRLNLSGLDTLTKIACYNVEIANLGPEEWPLGGVNINILYDASAARFIEGSDEISDNANLDYALGTTRIDVVNLPLIMDIIPYSMTLGYLRINTTPNPVSTGIILPPDGTWTPFFNLCFDILFDDITNPNTCLEMNFLDQELRDLGLFPGDVVQELVFNAPGVDVLPSGNINLVSDKGFDACFVVEENSLDLCTDGLDNDEDGLVDCQDRGCRFFNFCVFPEDDFLYMPTVFSLGVSNKNGQIVPRFRNNELVLILSYAIFDRSGNKVFSRKNMRSDDPSLIWDGKTNNMKVSSGVYVYMISIETNGLVKTFTGDFTALK